MLLAVLSGFLLAVFFLFAGKLFKSGASILLSLLPLSLFVYFLSFAHLIAAGEPQTFRYEWIPTAGIHLSFYLDGLSLLFALLITGIGTLVYLYASAYLKGHHYLDRFFGYLSLFMGSMLGLVLSDNLLTLFVFWELTSISSFFLIGFNNDSEASRKSALQALAITGGGGFLLLSGIILLNSITGTFSLQEMLQQRDTIQNHAFYGLLLFFIFGGAFTKSAQFPFHFWLPGAMKAPTPVSAYLHSATMVKAGVYLLARFTPLLGQHSYWNTTLMIIGGITMLYAAIHAIFRTDLKSILAYSTISALGMLVFLIGIGTQRSLIAAAVFILVHALYKAGLFLVAGVIDHETGTRDVTELNGLQKVMKPLAIAGLLAALSNAGIPFTFGFLGKDLVYEATLATGWLAPWLTAAVVLTNILLLFAGFLAGIKPFTKQLPQKFSHVHLPSPLMWAPPLLLGVGGLLFGSMPGIVDKTLVQPVVFAMHGAAVDIPLKIWHGFNLVLLLSVLTITAGVFLFFFLKPSHERLATVERLQVISPKSLLLRLYKGVENFSFSYTRTMQNGYLRVYILTILLFTIGLLAYRLFTGVQISLDTSSFSPYSFYEIVIVVIMFIAVLITMFTTSRLAAVAAMSVVGYSLCLLFVFYSAPDLAMTQFAIDTLTVVLFVLVLFKLPPFLQFANTAIKIRDGVISLLFGALIFIIAIEVLNESVNKEISEFYATNSYLMAKGKNVVNVILVDFRGADTMIEITVLTIAAIGVYSLLKLKVSHSEKE
ncbi:MAG TPA: putative monovalent cation/H+ antiporter subunit A [Flavisolibacter sp.]|jgi:multicomponent Na+:H+ antiporter subunit A|nr:putative monovalent cation/H+ antiporter subunit A [Flavisolibacter sp.]